MNSAIFLLTYTFRTFVNRPQPAFSSEAFGMNKSFVADVPLSTSSFDDTPHRARNNQQKHLIPDFDQTLHSSAFFLPSQERKKRGRPSQNEGKQQHGNVKLVIRNGIKYCENCKNIVDKKNPRRHKCLNDAKSNVTHSQSYQTQLDYQNSSVGRPPQKDGERQFGKVNVVIGNGLQLCKNCGKVVDKKNPRRHKC